MRIFIVIGLPIQQKMRILRVRISVKCNDGMHRQIELMHIVIRVNSNGKV